MAKRNLEKRRQMADWPANNLSLRIYLIVFVALKKVPPQMPV